MADKSADQSKERNDANGRLGYKLMATAAAMLGAVVARRSLAMAWRTATGKEPPANPEHPAVDWGEAAAWAIVSGAVMGLARMVAQKKMASTWHRATGSLPPDLEKTAA